VVAGQFTPDVANDLFLLRVFGSREMRTLYSITSHALRPLSGNHLLFYGGWGHASNRRFGQSQFGGV
jgi:hypothetical protein